MYMKKGQVFNSPEVKDNEHFLQNDEGKVYQVSETVLFVWDKLDGKTKMDDINDAIMSITDVDKEEIQNISKTITNQLESVNLVAEV